MGSLFLIVILCLGVLWPSVLLSRISQRSWLSGFCWFLGALAVSALAGAIAHFLFSALSHQPSSPKELESFLVNQGVLSLLVACATPWVSYFALKTYRNKSANGLR